MQKIVEQTRQKLLPFLGSGAEEQIFLEREKGVPAYLPNIDVAHFVRKIPDMNYQTLPKLIPISWL